jgi:hypothetical protein
MLVLMRMMGLLALVCLLAGSASAVPSNVAAWRRDGQVAGASLGAAVTTAGDFNCDGISDLAIGVPSADTLPNGTLFWTNGGYVGVWFGSATLPPQPTQLPDWFFFGGTNLGNNTGAAMGTAVAAGDVNRDGCDDLISSAPGASIASGELVNVFFGSASGLPSNFSWRRITNAFTGARFGQSVATGDVNGDGTADIIVGAPDANSGGTPGEGAVLVWLGSQFLGNTPDGDAGSADWVAQSNQGGANLGESVANAGDVDSDSDDEVLAGAPNWDGNLGGPVVDAGIAFMWQGHPTFESTPDGTPANVLWKMELGVAGAHVGASVAGIGDVDGDSFADVAVGAPEYNNPFIVGTNEGTVVVTRGQVGGPADDIFDWSHPGQLPSGRVGASVATAGDMNGDGYADYLYGQPGSQRANLVLGRPSGWGPNPATDTLYSEAATPQGFGKAVGTAGDWNRDGFSDAVIGAPDFNSGSGRAYVYLGRGETLAQAPIYTAQGTQQVSATFGVGVAFAGDINHDGYTDIVAGAPNFDDGATDEGRIFVYYSGSCGPACPPFNEIIFDGNREGQQAGANLGHSVAGAGDINGDGYADVIAGAPLQDNLTICIPPFTFCNRVDSGVARVWLGGSGGLAENPSQSFLGDIQAGAKLGYAVAGAGDLNGDGFGDVIVGAPFGGGTSEGKVYVYLGSMSGLTGPTWTKLGGQNNAHFGVAVAGAGDVNRDGYSDVIIGADGYNGTGAAFVYLGRPTDPTHPQGLWPTPVRTYLGPHAGSEFGGTVATAGDVNRDGFADVAVGAPSYLDDPDFGPQLGRVTVYHGGASGPSASANTTLYGSFPSFAHRFGSGVDGAGDVNGDGFGDLIVGDQWHEGTNGWAQGRAYIFHGSASGIVGPVAAREFEDCPSAPCDYGRNVAGAGDLNGDGYGDVLIGGYRYSVVAADAGAVFAHLGNEGRGIPVQPLQSGFSGPPLALLGGTTNWFQASANLRSPAGRTTARIQLEAKPLGTALDGTSLLTGTWLDNVSFPRDTLISLGSPNTPYTWRARVQSASPLFGRSRWVSLPGNAPRETDVRVIPEPGFAAGIVAGVCGLAWLERRRRTRSSRTDAQ